MKPIHQLDEVPHSYNASNFGTYSTANVLLAFLFTKHIGVETSLLHFHTGMAHFFRSKTGQYNDCHSLDFADGILSGVSRRIFIDLYPHVQIHKHHGKNGNSMSYALYVFPLYSMHVIPICIVYIHVCMRTRQITCTYTVHIIYNNNT